MTQNSTPVTAAEGFMTMAERAFMQRDSLIAALKNVIRDIHEYERANNLAPNPGRTECWDSVAHAKAIIASIEVKL